MSLYGLHSETYDGIWSNHNSITMTEGVRFFLENLGLVQYFDIFIIKGFDREDDICELNESDMDSLMISDPDHRRQVLGAGKTDFIYLLSEYTLAIAKTSHVALFTSEHVAMGKWASPV